MPKPKETASTLKVVEWIDVHKPHVAARIQEQQFYPLEGQEALFDPYYVFLSRANQNVTGGLIRISTASRPLRCASRPPSQNQIIDDAEKLTSPHIRSL
jgi:hypothetical protein